MNAELISLGAGALIGLVYALLKVRSPAPPAIALVGLLGMLAGEQLIPVCRRLLRRQPVTLAWFRHECVPKISDTPPPKAKTYRRERHSPSRELSQRITAWRSLRALSLLTMNVPFAAD